MNAMVAREINPLSHYYFSLSSVKDRTNPHTPLYAGTISPTLFQKSHRTPLPPSHVYASASVKLLRKPGPSYTFTETKGG